MLLGIDPALSPDLLRILCAMGHGDEIVIADANFPAEACAKKIVRSDGVDATRLLTSILSVLPLDSYVEAPAMVMAVVEGDPENPPVVQEFQQIIDATANSACQVAPIERFEFYRRATEAFAIVQTGERRLYGNIILKKGVVRPT
ncbi:RbsD/FucU family protein [Cognatishimia maritima]|uniref:L-fucose mutarotase n=1 Tax=Cognatishimia maritima TaxID=870908 RepID=A0A1M5QUK0_9RHOB|nr:RbsD/FucU family protein [Cognatishimia maritima]SHH17772.1 L-fucose mutarotase [Cognatishimia maritima]